MSPTILRAFVGTLVPRQRAMKPRYHILMKEKTVYNTGMPSSAPFAHASSSASPLRPESPLAALFPRLTPPQRAALARLGIATLADLLYHFPVRYGDTSRMNNIAHLTAGEQAVVFGTITELATSKGFRSKIAMATATVEDSTGSIKAVWFHQPYIAKMLTEGASVRIEGAVSARKKTGELYFSNPKVEAVATLPVGVGDSLFAAHDEATVAAHTLYPVYPESRGITSNWLYHAIQRIFAAHIIEMMPDPLPEDLLKRYNLPSLATALVWIHTPHQKDHADAARKRFAFEEVFFIQLARQKARLAYESHRAFAIEKSPEEMDAFISRFPFTATDAQKRAIDAILADFAKGQAMARLLEGDVGSGKTAVAASTAYAIVTSKRVRISNGIVSNSASTAASARAAALSKERQLGGGDIRNLQVAYMAPTEILAKQHFASFIAYFRHLPIEIGLLTGSGCRKFPSKVDPEGHTAISRSQLLKWTAEGRIAILIGTHALIQKAVRFKNLAFAVIDEQHRFGTAQRQKLVRKDGLAPHLLSMTATPIPRTLALTIFGDLDLTLLDQMPQGRKPIITEIVLPKKEARDAVYEKVRTELRAGRQAYVICPRIDEADPDKEQALIATSVTAEAARLKKSVFPEYRIGILHSKMKPEKKDEVMQEFSEKRIDILVATSVVEVGVNVPNATLIIIEGAERFGLSQLHQLRGRVMRGSHQPYCFLFAEVKTAKTLDRLNALKTAKNGFELAEKDFALRGAGELYGKKQWGISDIAMDAMKNSKMVEAARNEAKNFLAEHPDLTRFPLIAARVAVVDSDIHFE
jgi:ATP-dependent DNA helicase RecG